AWGGWLTEPSQSGGGVFDLLIHDVDFCLHLFGKPESVSSVGFVSSVEGIDCIDAQLFYPGGGVVSIIGGWHHLSEYPFAMEYTVTLGGCTLDYSSRCGGAKLFAPGEQPQDLVQSAADADGYGGEIGYFIDCCRMERPPALCPPRESADAVKLMLLLLE